MTKREKKALVAVELVENLTGAKLTDSEVEDLAFVLMGLTEQTLRDALKISRSKVKRSRKAA